jgi:hypothetical protein
MPMQNDLQCSFTKSFIVQGGYLRMKSLRSWTHTYDISMIFTAEFLWDSPYKENCIPMPKWFIYVHKISHPQNCSSAFISTGVCN